MGSFFYRDGACVRADILPGGDKQSEAAINFPSWSWRQLHLSGVFPLPQ